MKTKKSTTFIGFHISIKMDQWIQMGVIARNISVSQMVRELVEKWRDDNQITEEKSICGIVERMKTEHMVLSLRSKVDGEKFITHWKGILSKKLTTPLVNKIIKAYETSSTNPQ